ncbi:hypothetical protein [Viscerimonas tarda]
MKTTENTENLLGVFDTIQVRNEEKISQQDRLFCKTQQEAVNQALLQLDSWYAFFQERLPEYANTWKFDFQPNGTVRWTTIYTGLAVEARSYHQYAFTPFESINEIVKNRWQTIDKFSNNIIHYFNETYNVSVPVPEMDKENLSISFQPEYMTYVDMVIAHLGGRGFRETAEEELINMFHQTVHRYERHDLPELKAGSIIFKDLLRFDNFYLQYNQYKIGWEQEAHISRLCSGLVFYAHKRLNGDSGIICGYDRNNVNITDRYNLSTSPAEQLKFYKNGRVDVRFKDAASAEECFKKLKLHEL